MSSKGSDTSNDEVGDSVSTSSEVEASIGGGGDSDKTLELDGVSSSSSSFTEMEVTNQQKGSDESSSEISSSGDSVKVDGFAHPMLPPALPKAHQSISSSVDKPSRPQLTSSSKESVASSSNVSRTKEKERLSKEKQEKYNAILSSLNYHPPANASTTADSRYNLEVLKNGTIVDSVTFSPDDNKGYYVIGRIPGCDILAENPTVSRLHAILQFVKRPPKSESEENKNSKPDSDDEPKEPGLYIFDLKSTHGTFINKNQVFPLKFYRVHVGHVLKFGSSQRMYIVNGPSEDEEEESDKSVTELMNEKLQKDLERKRIEEEDQLKRTANSKLPRPNIEEEGINWGMAEDADEESDLRINPFAMDYEASELTLDNPKKTLRSWFEREGEDLEFEMKEKGNGQYVCRIPLPLDGPTEGPVYAESEVKAKKKEAVHDAALKACQILDSHGLLRASNQESRKRKERKYEDEDYYSSDDDTYLDRTGSVEKKREKRMKLAGKVEDQAETYESLRSKYSALETEITQLESDIAKSQKMKERADDGEMDIDDYMNMLKTGTFDVKKLRSRLKQASDDLQKTKKLIEIAKPAELPAYLLPKADQKPPPDTLNDATVSETSTVKDKSKLSPVDSSTEVSASAVSATDSSSKTNVKPLPVNKPQIGPLKPPTPSFVTNKKDKQYGLIMPSSIKPSLRTPDIAAQSAAIDELEKDEEESKESSEEEIDDDTNEPEFVPQSKSKRKRQRFRNKQNKSKEASSYGQDDPNYSVWVPPANQSGDGKTSLNDKLGY